jgi:hypothetical protein
MVKRSINPPTWTPMFVLVVWPHTLALTLYGNQWSTLVKKIQSGMQESVY